MYYSPENHIHGAGVVSFERREITELEGPGETTRASTFIDEQEVSMPSIFLPQDLPDSCRDQSPIHSLYRKLPLLQPRRSRQLPDDLGLGLAHMPDESFHNPLLCVPGEPKPLLPRSLAKCFMDEEQLEEKMTNLVTGSSCEPTQRSFTDLQHSTPSGNLQRPRPVRRMPLLSD